MRGSHLDVDLSAVPFGRDDDMFLSVIDQHEREPRLAATSQVQHVRFRSTIQLSGLLCCMHGNNFLVFTLASWRDASVVSMCAWLALYSRCICLTYSEGGAIYGDESLWHDVLHEPLRHLDLVRKRMNLRITKRD